MSPLLTFLISLLGTVASDLEPVLAKIVEGWMAGKSPAQVLADESVAAIIPPQWQTALAMASQRAKYAPGISA